jgi:hypothetical protein
MLRCARWLCYVVILDLIKFTNHKRFKEGRQSCLSSGMKIKGVNMVNTPALRPPLPIQGRKRAAQPTGTFMSSILQLPYALITLTLSSLAILYF